MAKSAILGSRITKDDFEIDSITDINEIIRDTIQDGWPTTIELTGTIRFEEVFA